MDLDVEFVGQLYRTASYMPCTHFRYWALRAIDRVVRHDAAIWGVGTNGDWGTFKNSLLMSLPRDFIDDWERKGLKGHEGDPLRRILTVPARSDVVCDSFETARLPAAGGIKLHYERYGIRSGLLARHANPVTRVSNVIVALNMRDTELTPNWTAVAAPLVRSVVDAASFSFFIHLSSPQGLDRRKVAAVCSPQGVLLECQQGFSSLIAERFPSWVGPKLPINVDALTERPTEVALNVLATAEPFENLRIIRLWSRCELDDLTPRERDLVTHAITGFSDKEIALQLCLSASTVSNRLVTAFRKLNVVSRTQLRQKYMSYTSAPVGEAARRRIA